MAKYSTGDGSGSGGSDACELCGKASDDLTPATVAGADLDVCAECAPHGETDSGGDRRTRSESDTDRRRRAAQNTARTSDAVLGDSEWVEDASYDPDRLPYLVGDYGARVEAARQDAGLQRDELADELDVDENDVLAVEQGRATRANVGGSVIRALEGYLDVTLVDE